MAEKNPQNYRPKHYVIRSDSSLQSWGFISSILTSHVEGRSSATLNVISPFVSASTVNATESIRSCLSVEITASSEKLVSGDLPQIFSSRFSLSFFEKNRITFKSTHPFEKNFAIFFDVINSIDLKQTPELQEITSSLNLKYSSGDHVNFNVILISF